MVVFTAGVGNSSGTVANYTRVMLYYDGAEYNTTYRKDERCDGAVSYRTVVINGIITVDGSKVVDIYYNASGTSTAYMRNRTLTLIECVAP